MENVPMPVPATSVPSLPHKSTFWSVGMIFITLFLFGFVGGFIVSIILLSSPSLSSSPDLVYYAFAVGLILNILGLWAGVNYVAKRSEILPGDVAKISLSVGVIVLILNFLKSSPSTGMGWVSLIIAVAVEVWVVWALLKHKATKVS